MSKVVAMHPDTALGLGLMVKEPEKNPFPVPYSFIEDQAPEVMEIIEEVASEIGEDVPQFLRIYTDVGAALNEIYYVEEDIIIKSH